MFIDVSTDLSLFQSQIFWAVDPIDVPVTLRENVEETIQDDAVGESKCAIVRYVDNNDYHQ